MSAYGRRTAFDVRLPNITSSFEKPKTNASARSISVTWTPSLSASDSRFDSSRQPKPAPRTRTEVATTKDRLGTEHVVEIDRPAVLQGRRRRRTGRAARAVALAVRADPRSVP